MIHAYMALQLEEAMSRPSPEIMLAVDVQLQRTSTASIKKREAPQALRNQTKIGT